MDDRKIFLSEVNGIVGSLDSMYICLVHEQYDLSFEKFRCVNLKYLLDVDLKKLKTMA